MFQQHVFPLASGLPTPTERLLNRERYSSVVALTLYVLFLVTPGAVAGLSVALGRSYGESVYRFFVSWLFFWVTGLLTLDPFITRYKAQLSDLIHHWKRVLSCTRTCLNISFEHGFLYYAMLWALSYAFVFVEAILALFWNLDAAIELTTFLFGTCLVVYLVIWIGRLVRQHTHLAFSNAPTPQSDDRFTRVAVPIERKTVEVQLATRPALNVVPEIHLTRDARLDLTDHLARNGVQMTVSGNVLTVEPVDAFAPQYRCYRAVMWVLLTMLGGFVLLLVLENSFAAAVGSFLGSFGTPWVEYTVLTAFAALVLVLVFFFGRKFADPTYLQFFLLMTTFFPTVYGSWLLNIYSTSDLAPDSSTAMVITVLHLVLSNIYLMLTQLVIQHFSAPYLYARFMMLPQTMAYLFEYVIFGFTPWSVQYLLVLLFSSTHNVLASTGIYWDIWETVYDYVTQRLFPSSSPINQPPKPAAKRLFEHLLATRHSMQLFAQDTIADVWSLVVVLTALTVVYYLGVPIAEIMPSFTMEPIVLRLAVLLVARILSWLLGQLIFRYKLDREAGRTTQETTGLEATKSLSAHLDDYLRDFGLSAFQTAELRACFEEDMPELFVLPAHVNEYFGHDTRTVDISKLSLRELIVMQVAERQWLLHPALLRKYFLLFHADMYLLLLIVFQTASQSLPLRYAWYKPT